jgi:6-phosphogluconolactonase
MTSRRQLLKAAVVAGSPALLAQTPHRRTESAMLAYVGAYSSPEGPEGSRGNGEGIYLFAVNPATGALSQRAVFANPSNPSWLALHPSRTHLYSGNEVSNFEGSSGSVTAYAIERASGRLRALNTVSSGGAGPAHISVHPSGRYVLTANYAGGTIAVLPIRPNGELGPATDVRHDEGTPGPAKATSAPPGSFAGSGHDAPHAHMIHADPAGRFVFSTDLGLDRIFIWKLDLDTGKLQPNDPPSVSVPPGDGPRHFAFHSSGRWMYSLQEESSTVIAFDYDAANGRLTAEQTVSTLPRGFAGTNFTSEIAVSPDDRYIYAANRLHDSIAWFAIGPSGTLTYGGETPTRGDYPRSFTIDPSGAFLYCFNQRSDAIVTFRIDRQTGALAFTGQYTPVGTPAVMVFLT